MYQWDTNLRKLVPMPVIPNKSLKDWHPGKKGTARNISLPTDLMPRRIELTRSTVRLEIGGVRW